MKLEKEKYILARYVDKYICETVKGNISEREWTGKGFVEVRRWEPVEPEPLTPQTARGKAMKKIKYKTHKHKRQNWSVKGENWTYFCSCGAVQKCDKFGRCNNWQELIEEVKP